MSKQIKITILFILLTFLILPQVASASFLPFDFGSDTLVPCGRNPNNPDNPPETTVPCNLCHVFVLVRNVISILLTLIILIAPLILIFGGFIMLTSAGVPERANHGKQVLIYTIVGLAIAFGAWMIINTVMNKLVNPEVAPWPWNKPTCGISGEPPQPPAEGKYCICDTDGENFYYYDYDSLSECSANCEDYCQQYHPFRYCCKSKQERCSSTPDPVEQKYCVCEVPVYDLDPNKFPDLATVIGKNVKTKNLNTRVDCEDKCTLEHRSDYCSSTLKPLEANLYCANKSELQSKKACAVNFVSSDCQIKTQWFPRINNNQNTCIDNSTCLDLITPGSAIYDSSIAKRCWRDGQPFCRCEKKRSYNYTDCCQLYRYSEEEADGGESVWDCKHSYKENRPCRLDCQYDKCALPSVEWRFQGDLEGTKDGQIDDATTALTDFLDCFYENAPERPIIGYISSITDIDIYKDRGQGLCNPQDCKKANCKDDKLCGSGKACDHSCGSCHYGGTCSSTKSYAVDFGDEDKACEIAKVAKDKCGQYVNYIIGPLNRSSEISKNCPGYFDKLNKEHNNHIHISVKNSCNCN